MPQVCRQVQDVCRGLGGADAEGCQEHARGQRNGRSRAQRRQSKPRSFAGGSSPGREAKAETSRAVEVWWARPCRRSTRAMLRETDTATGTGSPGATKPAHPRADDSVGAVVAHVRREADAWLQLRLHAAQEDLKRAIVTANVLAQWLPLAHADIEACHRGDAPRPVPWAWPSPAAAPHPEWTDDDRIQQMIARVQLDVVRARHRLYGDARKVQAASSENDREVARQKVADLFLLHGALDLAAQKRGVCNMTARLATPASEEWRLRG